MSDKIKKLYAMINWKAVFDIILPGIDYQVSVVADKLVLTAKELDRDKITVAFNNALDNPSAFQKILPFKRISDSVDTEETIAAEPIKYPSEPKNTQEAGLKILENIYGKSYFSDIDFKLKRLFTHCENSILLTKAVSNKLAQDTQRLRIKYLLSAFNNVDLNQLRRAYIGSEDAALKIPDTEDNDVQTVKGLIEKTLGLLELPNDKGQVGFFDFQRLWQALFPPKLSVLTTRQNEIEIVLDLKHFGSYLEVLLQDGYLVTQTGQRAEVLAFGKKPTLTPPLICDLVIDRSYSLKDSFQELKTDLLNFAKAMWHKNPDAEIHLTFFSTEMSPTVVYRKADRKKLMMDVNNTTVDADTRLFETILDVLDVRLKEQRINKKNLMVEGKRVLVVFTDGEDNHSRNLISEANQLIQKKLDPNSSNSQAAAAAFLMQEKLKEFGDNRPQIFTLGVEGQNGCCEDVLKIIANETAGEFISLPKIEDFKRISRKIAEMQIAHRFVEVAINLEQKITIPLALDDTLQEIASFQIPQDGNVNIYFDGKQTSLIAKNPKLNITDSQRLTAIIKKFYQLENVQNHEEKAAKLSKLTDELNSLELTGSEAQLQAAFKNNIQRNLGNKVDELEFANVRGLQFIKSGVSLLPRGQKNIEDYKPGMRLGSMVYYKPKPAGIEPGFLGFLLDEEFYSEARFVIEQFLQKQVEIFIQCKNTIVKTSDEQDYVNHFLADGNCAVLLLEQLDKDNKVPLRFQKQDYKDPAQGSDQVGPDEHDLMRTNTVKKIAKVSSILADGAAKVSKLFAKKSIVTRNLEAILETLSTGIASFYMDVQKQELIPSSYEEGQTKYLTSAVWSKGFRDFSNQLLPGPNNQGILVKTNQNGEPLSGPDNMFNSDDAMPLGIMFVVAVLLNDYDFFGSKGQNKGCIDNEPFGIDIGHALRGDNKIAAEIQTDFSAKWPSKYKNYSICSDRSIEELNQGLLILQKLRTGIMPEEKVLAQYPRNFQDKLAAIKPYADVEMFDSFAACFSENETYIEGIKLAKIYYLSAAETLLTQFKERINLSPMQLKIIDNLEKLCSKTTHIFEASDNKKVQLNHLCKLERIAFEPEITDRIDCFQLSAQNGKQAQEKYQAYVNSGQLNTNGIEASLQNDGSFLITIPISQLNAFYKLFSEKKIAVYKEQPLPYKQVAQSQFFISNNVATTQSANNNTVEESAKVNTCLTKVINLPANIK